MRSLALRFSRNRAATLGFCLLVAFTLLASLASTFFPQDPFSIVDQPFQPPFGKWLLGTDSLGRNVAACIAYGARTSLLIGVVSTLIAVSFGTFIGGVAGYMGGWVDAAVMRFTEFFQTIPSIIFAITLVAILSPSAINLTISIAIVSWPPIARLVRGEFASLRNREFVQAAIALGVGQISIMFREMLPNATSPIIVTGSLLVATAILLESALSFLGLGDPNLMSWGFMIAAGRSFLRDAWWLCAAPGIAVLLAVLSINLCGEGLNDALNPRLGSNGS